MIANTCAPVWCVMVGRTVGSEGDRTVAVRPREEATARYAPRERIELAEHALIPGLVNAHTHNPMTLMRGLADDLPLMRWLREHIWPAEAKFMGPEFVRDGGDLGLAEVLRGNILVHNHCYRADEMAQMIDIAHEFGYKIRSFHHGVEAYKIGDLLAREGIGASIGAAWGGFKREARDAGKGNKAWGDTAGGKGRGS